MPIKKHDYNVFIVYKDKTMKSLSRRANMTLAQAHKWAGELCYDLEQNEFILNLDDEDNYILKREDGKIWVWIGIPCGYDWDDSTVIVERVTGG